MTNRIGISGCAAALLLLSTAPRMEAQERTGRLRGRATDEVGTAIAGARVSISGAGVPGGRDFRADDAGWFAAPALPPGEYRLQLRALGFRDVLVERVLVRLGQTTSLGLIVLRRAQVALSPVVVISDAAGLDPVSTEVSTSLDVRAVEMLPTGRDHESLVLLLPQAHASYRSHEGLNIAGGTGLENAFYVDGVNVTEGFRHNGGISLPPGFVDHIELKTGGYEAEFGRATGGIVSVTTRSGTNTPWLSAFSYYTASSLASDGARAAFDFGTGRFLRQDIGVAAGGPVVRDRLWYFAAYDVAVAREDLRIPGGPQTDQSRADQFAAKLTWRADGQTTVSATVAGDPRRRDVVGNAFWGGLPIRSLANPEPYLGYWNQSGVAASVAALRTVGSHWLLDASASRVWFRDETGPRTAAGASSPLVLDFVTGQWSGGHGNRWDRRAGRTAFSLSASWERGDHTAKVGVQLEQNDQRERWQWPGDGPSDAGVIFHVGSDQFVALPLDHRARTRTRIPTLFAQTSALVLPRLRLNGGLRWEAQRVHSPTTGRSGSIGGQLQPRLGAIVYPTGTLTQKLTASAGRFYEQVPNQVAGWYWGGLRQQAFIYPHDPRTDPSGAFAAEWGYVAGRALVGQHYDEATLGWERELPRAVGASVRASRRVLRAVLQEIAVEGSPDYVLGNPGRGAWASLPAPSTRYDALEATLGRMTGGGGWMLSYVLSRRRGNYVGVRDQDNGNPNAHTARASGLDGLLPNDRTHALKAFGARRVHRTLTLGAIATGTSGTPMTEQGLASPDPASVYFVGRRGAAGRTPFLRDLSLRGTWDVPGARSLAGARVALDLLHAFSPRKAVFLDQVRWLALDDAGRPTTPNPFYGTGLQFQPPMTLRIGVELGGDRRGAGAGR